jgi:hypothetical protein
LLSIRSVWADIPTQYAFTNVPAHFETQNLTVGSRALGEVCYSRDVMPDGTVCNPAYLPYFDDSTLLAQVYIGNGYAAFSTAQSFLYSSISQQFLQQLFQQNNTTSLEAQAGLVFATKYFSASFIPYRIQYVSEVHNPNLPVLEIHAALERALTFSGGIPLSWISSSLDGLTFGTDLKIISRKYVHNSFSLLDAASEPISQLLPVQNQIVLETDPTLAWKSYSGKWVFLTSITGTSIGYARPYDPLYADPADIAIGWGVEPPIGFGRLRFSLDLVNLINAPDLSSRVRFGTSYKFGILETMVGVNTNDFTAGMEFAAPILNVGLVYEFVRNDIEGGVPATNIATEFSFKF